MLAPFSIKRIIKGLVEEGVFFSVATGALNHGNVKMFLADVRSYTVEREVIYCLHNNFQYKSKNSLEMLENAGSVLKSIDFTMCRHLQMTKLIPTFMVRVTLLICGQLKIWSKQSL